MWCGDCRRSKKFLDERKIAYTWIDVDNDAEAMAFVQKVNGGNQSIPTIVFPDGSTLVEPSNAQLAQKLGLAV
jgi:glutaredoxin-like protein